MATLKTGGLLLIVIASRGVEAYQQAGLPRVQGVWLVTEEAGAWGTVLYQAARLFELLPRAPNELWQADVTYLHIPGHGWWYVVTVIDYYSRYLRLLRAQKWIRPASTSLCLSYIALATLALRRPV